MAELGSVLRLKRPTDEGGEPARARLHVAHPLEVLDALGQRLADAVHHRHRRLHPLLVRELHDLEPAVGAGFLWRGDVPHALNEDLPSAARDRVEPRGAQLPNDLTGIESKQLGEEVDLAWR